MKRTVVVNMRRQIHDVDCTRPGPWGNPFRIGPDMDRNEAILRHRQWFLSQPGMVIRAKIELSGKQLGCVCKPLKCHCDMYAEVCNEALNDK